jgi:hypothetical protein
LKKTYEAVRKLKEPPGISGVNWDDDRGVNITEESPAEAKTVWADLVAVCEYVKSADDN